MAKVSTIKFNLNGTDQHVHVNCGSDGFFKARIPEEIAMKLNLNKTIETATLALLEKEFHSAIKRYKEAETHQELLIAIQYGANGRFCEKENGDMLFGGYANPLLISLSWHSESSSVLLFDFKVICKETIDTVVTYYEADLGKNFPGWSSGENKDKIENHPNEYFKTNESFRLKNGEWKVSELLYKFISQDEKKIEYTLTKTKLLN